MRLISSVPINKLILLNGVPTHSYVQQAVPAILLVPFLKKHDDKLQFKMFPSLPIHTMNKLYILYI